MIKIVTNLHLAFQLVEKTNCLNKKQNKNDISPHSWYWHTHARENYPYCGIHRAGQATINFCTVQIVLYLYARVLYFLSCIAKKVSYMSACLCVKKLS